MAYRGDILIWTKTVLAVVGMSIFVGSLLAFNSQFQGVDDYPALDRSTDLSGPDSNGDGVRDDIGGWVQNRFADPAQQMAALRAARAMQEVFSVDLTNREAVKRVNMHIAQADNCLYQAFAEGNPAMHPAEVSTRLESMATNTRARLTHYLQFNQALDGAVWSTDHEGC